MVPLLTTYTVVPIWIGFFAGLGIGIIVSSAIFHDE